MRNTLVVIAGIILVALTLGFSGVLDALFIFLAVGAIPSTNYSISPIMMLVLIGIITWLCFVFISHTLYRVHGDATKQVSVSPLPKRRYGNKKRLNQ